MSKYLFIILIILVFSALFTVVLGVWGLKDAKNKKLKLQNNKLMFIRVVLQGTAVAVLLLLYLLN